jgi:anti-anti-sigma regulatory factor
LTNAFGLLSKSKAELITTDMHPASARTTAKTGFKIPKAAKLKATMFQMNA